MGFIKSLVKHFCNAPCRPTPDGFAEGFTICLLPKEKIPKQLQDKVNNQKFKMVPYCPELVKRARELRKNLTPAEKRLWKYINRKQLLEFVFDRQEPIDACIVDFYCKQIKLAIEIDGQCHDFKAEYDLKRQQRLESFGIKVIQFSEKKVLE